jgi:putative hydrolase of HD superfamily
MEKEKAPLKPYANFLFEVGILARTPRSGFRHLGGSKQSVAEHLCRTAYVGFVLAHLEQNEGVKLDVGKVVERCLFHDLGEARTLDLDYISRRYSKNDELKAIRDAVKDLPFRQRIVNAFKETEERSTIEGNIAKDADNLELICSLKEIIDSGNMQAKPWISPVSKRLRTQSAKKLAKELLRTNSNNWWFTNKNDEHWITGENHSKGK